MRHEIIERYTPPPNGDGSGPREGTIMRVRIYPEDTPVRLALTALVMGTYDLSRDFGVRGLGGLGALGSPKRLSVDDAATCFRYEEEDQRTNLERWRGLPDVRDPSRVRAGFLHGYAMKLDVQASNEVLGSYDMPTHVFVDQVGPIDSLFQRVEALLPFAEQELAKSPLRRSWERSRLGAYLNRDNLVSIPGTSL